jgi:hypothetical protein
MLPHFLGIGAPRCGTTMLDNLLRTHTAFYLPVQRKEIDFYASYFDRTTAWYERFFQGFEASGATYCGEITPGYLKSPEAPWRIKSTLTDPRFIVILRDPVERMVSRYKYGVARKGEQTSFAEMASRPKPFESGCYASALRRYFEHFERDRFLIMFFDDLEGRPMTIIERLASHFCVDVAGFDARVIAKRVNNSSEVLLPHRLGALHRIAYRMKERNLDAMVDALRKPMYGLIKPFNKRQRIEVAIPAEELTKLSTRYEPEIADLEDLLGVDLKSWRSPYISG